MQRIADHEANGAHPYRITRLRNCSSLEAAGYAKEKHLGELKCPSLTP
ncbi:hypothetical protein G7B40_009700 [Aetokthonos hydrillicola Thurmond2011]|jgi:hypothetical protein|uniref:Uncharacterized protein n=1 Tax=Aetokthonos hydrillicola Thurmond2011 TaxID=2712845 RepID=A0AAP5I7T6_9CYAN|nr:hypothetical protein [Aetokthonos hydrillicola]MBW4590268.1 hypothetical protein [Aetokthonos hydrillicola CCALA 1050]MDR9894838.1 hypothetical protein [Aetokthonos hydrillicola Thurmond2011]